MAEKTLPILVDQPDDGFCENWGWVPVAMAATEVEALAVMDAEVPIAEGEPLRYEVCGKVTLAPVGGSLGDEYGRWHPAEPDAEDAGEFWKLEVVDSEPRL